MVGYQWWRDVFRCRIDLLNFSMGFNIIAIYMDFLHLNWCICRMLCNTYQTRCDSFGTYDMVRENVPLRVSFIIQPTDDYDKDSEFLVWVMSVVYPPKTELCSSTFCSAQKLILDLDNSKICFGGIFWALVSNHFLIHLKTGSAFMRFHIVRLWHITVYSKRNTHLIPIFFVAPLVEGGQKFTWSNL